MFLAGLAQAQVGVRLGTNLLAFATEASAGARPATSSQLGYQVGVYYQQPLTNHFSLVPEIQFSREQTQVDFEEYRNAQNYARGTYHLNLSYVNVPVLLRFSLGRVHFEAGPEASLLVGGRGTGQTNALIGGDGTVARKIDQSAVYRFRRVNLGACVGIGVLLPAGLGLDVRAYQGLVSVNQATQSQAQDYIPYWGGDMYRQTLQASLTYQLTSR